MNIMCPMATGVTSPCRSVETKAVEPIVYLTFATSILHLYEDSRLQCMLARNTDKLSLCARMVDAEQ